MCLMVNQYMIIIFPSCFIKLISAWYLPIDSHTDGFVTNEETIIMFFPYLYAFTFQWPENGHPSPWNQSKRSIIVFDPIQMFRCILW
jgi:hypothetical protein